MIRIAVTIDTPPATVWAFVRDISTHVDWMTDAVAIRFTSGMRDGVGATFECDTKVGPLRLTDRMEVTEWVEGRTMGIRHVGLVTGTGRFTLALTDRGTTRFAWEEALVFPWWMGGRIGGLGGGVILRLIWRHNLRTLKAKIERSAP